MPKLKRLLILCIKNGDGVEQSDDKANEYFALAAEQGVGTNNLTIFDKIINRVIKDFKRL